MGGGGKESQTDHGTGAVRDSSPVLSSDLEDTPCMAVMKPFQNSRRDVAARIPDNQDPKDRTGDASITKKLARPM